MPVLGRAQPWHKKWEFQNICCLIQGCQVYSFICSQTLWKTSAICHELKVNWSKIAVDYCGHCDWKRCPVSQQLQELLTPGSSTEPRNLLAVPAHPRGSAGTWGRRGCRERGGTSGTSRCHFSIRPWPDVSVHSWPWGQGKPLQSPPAPWALLAHLFTPTLAAIDNLSGWEVMLTELRFHLHLMLFKEEQESSL